MRKQKVADIPGTRLTLHGFSRVMLKNPRTGEVSGDSGWVGPNMVVNGGVQQFILNLIGKTTGSLQVAGVAVGTTTTAVASNDTSMAGEYGGTAKRHGPGNGGFAVTTSQRAASNGTATLMFSCSWTSSENTGSSNIANIGLFDMTTAQGSLFAGNTYSSSQWSNNQDLYASYQIRVSFS